MTRKLLISGQMLPATAEQNAILDAVSQTRDNITIVALAGAAKTRTLEAIAAELPNRRILSLAFNKNIAEEMKKKLPENCDCLTLNSLAHRAFCKYLSKWPKISTSKNFSIVKELDVPRKLFTEVFAGLKESKLLGYTPNRMARSMLSFDEMIAALSFEPAPEAVPFIKQATIVSNRQLFQKKPVMDFDEQILGAATFPVTFPHYDVVLVDEAQDLSPLNHKILARLKAGRLIVVGDPLQAIYAFRGAHEHSMQQLAEQFSTTEYRLTTTFRCAKTIVREAQWLAKDMKAADWAPEGIVESLTQWNTEHIKEADAVLCRFNSPLFFLNSILFSKGINSEFVGHDIVRELQKILKTFGNVTSAEVLEKVVVWEEVNSRKYKKSRAIADKANCIRVLCTLANDSAGMQAHLRRLTNDKGRIKLMTIHKSKGLEFNSVFILDPDSIGDEGQEKNIRYVAQTRAKQRLVYISGPGFQEN